MYNEPQEKRKCCDNLIKKETNKTKYKDIDADEKIDPKLHSMSKIKVLIMVIHQGVQKIFKGVWSSLIKLCQLYFDQGNSKKKCMKL